MRLFVEQFFLSFLDVFILDVQLIVGRPYFDDTMEWATVTLVVSNVLSAASIVSRE